jgi:hypothetical protein
LSPYISCEAYIFSMEREGTSEGIVFVAVRDKNGEDH